MSPSSKGLVALALALILGACDADGAPATNDAAGASSADGDVGALDAAELRPTEPWPALFDHPAIRPYPPAELPWRMRPDLIDVGRNVWYREPVPLTSSNARTMELTEPLVEVVALDDYVVVIFPPAEPPGDLRIAWAGRDAPWRSVLAWEPGFTKFGVQDLDAIAGPDGETVHLVARMGASIAYLTFHPGAPGSEPTVTRELIGGGGNDGWYSGRCADLAIGISPAGDVDVIYEWSQGLGQLRRPAGGGGFEPHRVWDIQWDGRLDALGRVAFAATHSVGCRNQLAYDDGGRPFVMTVARPLPEPAQTSEQQLDYSAGDERLSFHAFTVGANGEWQRAGSPLAADSGYQADPSSRPGRFVLEQHPGGFLLAGIVLQKFDLGLVPFAWRGIFGARGTFGAPTSSPFAWSCGTACDYSGTGYPRDVLAVERDTCGRYVGWYARSRMELPEGGVNGAPPALLLTRGSRAAGGCADRRRAPVVWRVEHTIPDPELARIAWTHGPRPYHAGLCIAEDGRMVICYGGFRGQLQTYDDPGGIELVDPATVMDPADVIEITAADVAEGEVVPVDRASFTVTLSDWRGGAEPTARPTLWDTFRGVTVPVTPERDVAAREVTLLLDAPLEAGHSYLLLLETQRGVDDPAGVDMAILHRGKRRAIAFSAAGAPYQGDEDPRDSELAPPMPRCDPTRSAETGVCTMTGVIATDQLLLIFPDWLGAPLPDLVFRRIGNRDTIRLFDPDGVELYPGFDFNWTLGSVTLVLDAPLRPYSAYRVELPELYDRLGRRLRERELRVETTWGEAPPTLVATVPAPDATGVPVGQALRLEFDMPMQPLTLVEGVTLLGPLGDPVSISLVQEDGDAQAGRVFRVEHPPLAPLAAHTLQVASWVTGASGAPMGAPVTVRFTTGGQP